MKTSERFDTEHFLEKLENRTLRVGVIGTGYVGLPLALTFAERAGLVVSGFDTNEQRVTQLNAGEPCVMGLDATRLRMALRENRFSATSDFVELVKQDVLIVTVPTPLNEQREPDLSFVEHAAKTIARYLQRDMLVVLSSTSYPGTTEEFFLPILESCGLKCGIDFLLAYSPEREDPGNRHYETTNIPKLVGGIDKQATEVATAFFRTAVEKVVPVASAKVAEAAKLTENVFRAVNIALVNELKVAYEKLGLDVWDVLDAAATKPFGFMRFNPGPGLGGHCIPVDPVFLSWKVREAGAATRLVDLAAEVNQEMPLRVLTKLLEAFKERSLAIEDSKVLVLGLAYKKDIDDTRESPALEIIELLLQHRAAVGFHDPYISKLPVTLARWDDLPEPQSVELTTEVLSSYDATIIVTDHGKVDYAVVQAYAPLVIDTRGVYRKSYANVVRA